MLKERKFSRAKTKEKVEGMRRKKIFRGMSSK
jgi:hypothetical protein